MLQQPRIVSVLPFTNLFGILLRGPDQVFEGRRRVFLAVTA